MVVCSPLVQVGNNNAEREGTTVVVRNIVNQSEYTRRQGFSR